MKKLVTHFNEIVSSITFTMTVLVVTVNVFSRFLFGHSFSFTEEIAFIGFTYSVFLGAVILFKTRAHVAIDIVVDKLPEKLQGIVTLLTYLLLFVANVYFLYLSTYLSIEAWIRRTAALDIPYTFIDLAAAYAFLVMAYYSLKFIIVIIKNRGRVPDVDEDHNATLNL
jgi:TRAP-type C4-dicarboxylate transport system permease small subunit